MITRLAAKHTRKIAAFYLFLFYFSFILPTRGVARDGSYNYTVGNVGYHVRKSPAKIYPGVNRNAIPVIAGFGKNVNTVPLPAKGTVFNKAIQPFIGGPSQPEMSSFKSVSTANLVNLFTGDFNYNIPLLDVGGYPVNIYYDGGITPDQEASWVGLGFNVNPGNINRSTRGVPDDFNGQDTLKQTQKMRPNKTWGVGVGADVEIIGWKGLVVDSSKFSLTLGSSIGVAFNNYLGPSLDFSLRGSAGYKIAAIAGTEKLNLNPKLDIGMAVNSRSGTSFSGGVSLQANGWLKNNNLTFGGSLSTGYNSRSGIKALQVSEQVHFSNYDEHKSKALSAVLRKGIGLRQSTSISFVKPSYIPSLRMPLTNTAWSGHFQMGTSFMGIEGDVEAEAYGQKSEVADADVVQKKPMVGYLYYQNAVNNPDYVMDFTRFNDREVTPNTPVISVPQYSYDIFSVQGEGTGGSIRAYRNDLGYVRDNVTISKDKNLSIGADIAPMYHWGVNINTIKTPSTIGEWGNGNKLRNSIQFTKADGVFENVYFRNPGEMAVIDANRYARIGGTDLVRFKLGGNERSPSIEPKLQAFDRLGNPLATQPDLSVNPVDVQRNKRTQVISFLTATEASAVGLDKLIRSYDNTTFLDPVKDTLLYESIQRVSDYRKAHHISQVNVTENNGRRYVYGIPVYNIVQKDFSFSVDNSYSDVPEKVNVNALYASAQSPLLSSNANRDGYVQITETPASAHSFLLSGILSPDYVDVRGDGITEDDMGDAVKFNYSRIKSGGNVNHKWRTPLTPNDSASFNAGLRSEVKDDKAMIVYGERESWYLQSVESKTMIALFYVSNRLDGKGPMDENGGVDANDNFAKKLDSISLFSKADLKMNGLAKAKPVKTVHFEYSYLLCQNTPDNPSGSAGSKGKLTLNSIYFTYNGKSRVYKNRYNFYYNSTGSDNKTDNPDYMSSSADRWGNYKPRGLNPDNLTNADYPYTRQDAGKQVLDQNAATWALKKVVLPSGGQIEIKYESDDYAFVQNKRACDMMQVVGFGSTTSYSASTNNLYKFNFPSSVENDYAFIQVPISCANSADVYNKYLKGLTQLSFKIWVQMPKGYEYIPCYAGFGGVAGTDYGVDATNSSVIWVKMSRVGGKSPVSIAALEFLRQQLPAQAYKAYDVSGEPPLQQIGDMLLGMLQSMRDAFTDPVNALRKDGKAMSTVLTKCFVRLNDPDGIKYGGGYRVKSVLLKDNWDKMTGQYNSTYGQQYDYTTTENFNGTVRQISSGVASYEPSIGGEENPWQTVIQVEDYLPSGPTSYGAVEMPVLDAFFPSPLVGYSKVTVSSVKLNTDSTKKSRSGVGKQVSEFYTAKDYPVYYNYTPFDAESVKEFHQNSSSFFLSKTAYDYKAQTQGFVVVTNNMHGKMKSQSSYAENDTATRINYTENFYKNTGTNDLNDKFSFISNQTGGTLSAGNMGVDVELMTDTREFSVKSSSNERQAQVDIFQIGPFPIPVPTYWPVKGISENIYRAVTTTKVISYHGVLDSVVVIDKGSQVSTKNMAYDAETGEVLVSRTNNEFNRPIYNTSYPAWWAYNGMGQAYKNIDAVYSGINFLDGRITNGGFDLSVFESGDEILVKSTSYPSGGGCDVQLYNGYHNLLWVFDLNKTTAGLPVTRNLVFMDSVGRPITLSNAAIRIIRSGKRNMLEGAVATVTTMTDPLATGKLLINSNSNVVNAGAAEYREKWQTDNDVFRRLRLYTDPATCVLTEIDDSTGYLEKSINPYRKGLYGNFRNYRSMVFYDGRLEYDSTASTKISDNGFLKNFKPYWDFNASNNLIPDTLSTQWVWNSRLNKVNAKGLELETQDAMGIYTSAQYGYNKTLPVAIASNARYNEMFAEGFEDYGYGESISNARYNFYKKHIDFSKASGTFLVNTDTTNFKAHTGKYVLGVSGNSSISIPVVNDNADFSNNVTGDNLTTVVRGPLGGNFTYVNSGVNFSNTNTTFSQGNNLGGVWYTLQPYTPASSISGNVMYSYYITTKAYFEIPAGGTYTLKFRAQSGYYQNSTLGGYPAFSSISVYDSINNIAYSGTDLGTVYETSGSTKTKNFCLPKGVYILSLNFVANYNYSCSPGPYTSFCNTGGGSDAYLVADQFSVLDNVAPSYSSIQFFKSYSTAVTCSYTKPIPASDSMYQKGFSATGGKSMIFSAWVKEPCGDPAGGVSCKAYTYTHNQVQLQCSAGGTPTTFNLLPSGAIIDGWQRYEGVVNIPTGTTNVDMSLVNNNGSSLPAYFDDIRMHPYNANMKAYVYDPVNLRLRAELDANNYATFYEYDEEGTLIRTKVETREGIKTVTETRSALQKVVQ